MASQTYMEQANEAFRSTTRDFNLEVSPQVIALGLRAAEPFIREAARKEIEDRLQEVGLRALGDPGSIVPRGKRETELEWEPDGERLIDWQLRALLASLASQEVEHPPEEDPSLDLSFEDLAKKGGI